MKRVGTLKNMLNMEEQLRKVERWNNNAVFDKWIGTLPTNSSKEKMQNNSFTGKN